MYQKLISFLQEKGEPPFRQKQLADYVFRQKIFSPAEFKQWPKKLRQELADFNLMPLSLAQVKESGRATKFVFQTKEKFSVEGVSLKHHNRLSFCLSTQINCPFSCRFCATGQLPFRRHLSAWEMVSQVLLAEKYQNCSFSHLLFMGMGEPFLNFSAVAEALKIFSSQMNKGARKMTVSTLGLPEGIKKFAALEQQYRLAVSLHAPNDNLRQFLMPDTRAYPLKDLWPALVAYYQKTKRRITLEYLLLNKVNDSEKEAEELVNILQNLPARFFVNLIEYNPHERADFQPSSLVRARKFQSILEKQGIACAWRHSLGKKVRGACGQLGS